jgi:hypothetical protein
MKRFCAKGHWGLVVLVVLGAAAPCAWADISYSSVVQADNPVGYYRLGESGSAAIAVDSSGAADSRQGFYSRGVVSGVPGAIKGDPDTAASFDGMTSFVEIAGGTSSSGALHNPFTLTVSFTVEAWVINAGSLENYSRILSTRVLPPATSGGYGLGIIGSNNNVRFTTFGVKDYDSANTNIPVDGNWHHIVVVLDSGNNANFYLDGVFTDFVSHTAPANRSPSNLHIGRNPVPDGNTAGTANGGLFEFWNGSIDEVAIYNQELTDAQIAAHFAAAQ